MTNQLLEGLEPQLMWKYFFELSQIPRGSKKEAAAADWVAEQGRLVGCEVIRDEVGNVVLRKPATPGLEGRPGIVMQSHVDMVCEKNEGVDHDFDKDPIKLRIDGDLLKATDTTLGADNGIGVAASLAIMATPGLKHGPLEALITIDEETGMTGAFGFGPGILKGKYFLNIDSEEEGYLTIGCAGGIDTNATYKAHWQPVPAGHQALRLKVCGLKGGHSGIDIANGRGNAIRFLARVLYRLQQKFGISLSSMKGGNKRNAIAREAQAILTVETGKLEALKAEVSALEFESQQALGSYDPGLKFSLEAVELPAEVIEQKDARAIVNTLFSMVHGVVAMSPAMPGLVQTSTNLGVLYTEGHDVVFNLLHRSSIDSSKQALVERVTAHLELAGFEAEHHGAYPGWKPEPGSDLVKLVTETHQEVYGKEMKIMAIHAGLECGLIGEKYPGMQMVSIGPDMWDVHTPEEKVSISSVASFWKLMVALVEKL